MEHKKQQEEWDAIENAWNKSSEGKEVKIIMTQLVEELQSWTSPFEQDTIRKDIALIKASISEFEKESIKKDIIFIERNTSQFEKNLAKSLVNFFTRRIKKILSKISGKGH